MVESSSKPQESQVDIPNLETISASKELKNQTPVYFQITKGSSCYFFFDVGPNTIVRLKAWGLRGASNPDLYMNVNQSSVDSKTCQWKSNNFGSNEIRVFPDHPKFQEGTYRVQVEAFSGDPQQAIGIEVQFKEAKPVSLLQRGEFSTHTVTDSIFFKYCIQEKSDFENLLLLLNVSKKSNLQVFINRQNYPGELNGEYNYVAGDLSNSVVQKFREQLIMRVLFDQAQVFMYDEQQDTVVYNMDLTDQEFDLKNADLLDSVRLQKLTTWTPQKLKLDNVTEQQGVDQIPDKIDLLFEGSTWAGVLRHEVFIGIYNSKPEDGPIEFSLQVREYLSTSLLPDELQAKLKVFDEVHKDVDANHVSNEGRSHLDLCYKTELIYGEVVFQYFIPLLGYLKPQKGEIFYDLGCGSGKPLICASMAYPELQVCKGIEYLEGLAQLGQKVTAQSIEECKKQGISCAPIEVRQGDILSADWFDADIIFTNSPLFPDALIDGIADLSAKLKKGARIISLKELPARGHLHPFASMKVKMSWGNQITFFYKVE